MKERKIKIRTKLLKPRKNTGFYPTVLADSKRTIVTEEDAMKAMPYVRVTHLPATNPVDERI